MVSGNNHIWKGTNETFLNFSTGNSDDEKIRDFVIDQAKFTFARVKGYWSELLATNEMVTADYEANIATESVVANSFVG